MKSNYSYSPSCRATQTKSKIRGLHVKEAILLRLMSGCVEAAGEQQQVLCVHVPAGTSAYIRSAEGFLKAPPTSVSSTVYAEMCCCTTHTLFHLPSTFQHWQQLSAPPRGQQGYKVNLWHIKKTKTILSKTVEDWSCWFFILGGPLRHKICKIITSFDNCPKPIIAYGK